MRHKKTASLALATATATALAFGGVSAANSADSGGPSASESSARANSPLPHTDALLAQTRSLGNISGVLKPVTDLLNDVLRADGGKLTPGQANQHADAVQQAIAAAQETASATKSGGDHAAAPNQLVTQAGVELQTRTDVLIEAATEDSPDAEAVKTALTAMVSGAVNVVVAPVLGDDLPAPDLQGLPDLPAA